MFTDVETKPPAEWATMNGRLVESFDYLRPEGEALYACDDLVLTLHVENCGDRLEMWVVTADENGRELSRTNTRNIASIEWMP